MNMDDDMLFKCKIIKPTAFKKTLNILKKVVTEFEFIVTEDGFQLIRYELNTEGFIHLMFPKEKFQEIDDHGITTSNYFIKFPSYTIPSTHTSETNITNNNQNEVTDDAIETFQIQESLPGYDLPALFYQHDNTPMYSFTIDVQELLLKMKIINDKCNLIIYYSKQFPTKLCFEFNSINVSAKWQQHILQNTHAPYHKLPELLSSNLITLDGQSIYRQLYTQNAIETPFINMKFASDKITLTSLCRSGSYAVDIHATTKVKQIVKLQTVETRDGEEISNDFSVHLLQKYLCGYKVNKICTLSMTPDMLILKHEIGTIGYLYFVLSPYVQITEQTSLSTNGSSNHVQKNDMLIVPKSSLKRKKEETNNENIIKDDLKEGYENSTSSTTTTTTVSNIPRFSENIRKKMKIQNDKKNIIYEHNKLEKRKSKRLSKSLKNHPPSLLLSSLSLPIHETISTPSEKIQKSEGEENNNTSCSTSTRQERKEDKGEQITMYGEDVSNASEFTKTNHSHGNVWQNENVNTIHTLTTKKRAFDDLSLSSLSEEIDEEDESNVSIDEIQDENNFNEREDDEITSEIDNDDNNDEKDENGEDEEEGDEDGDCNDFYDNDEDNE